MGLEEELDRLYALPLNEFTAARDDVAKRLRGEGERELADEVKQLRKPPIAAWLVNQLGDRQLGGVLAGAARRAARARTACVRSP